MRLVPRTLFSRLLLVLLGGLVVAQLLSLAIHLHERGELLSQASGMQSAQRIADIVNLLDTLEPSERPRIVRVLGTPQLAVTLGPAKPVDAAADAELPAHAVLFESLLRRHLGDERQVSVTATMRESVTAPAAMHAYKGGGMNAQDRPYAPGMRRHAASVPAFVVALRLRDGDEITFDSRQPDPASHWPYRLLTSLAILLISVIIVSAIAVRWATRPLNLLADAAEELGRNIHRAPLAEEGPAEVSRAARAFNQMQTRLIRYIEDRTRILAAMSHDLKTPITRLRLRSELLEDEPLRAKFTADLAEMESMVGTTLDFMRGIGNDEAHQPVDIMALLESLQADMREVGGAVSIDGGAQSPYPARPQALKRCLANLLDNAIKYGKSARIVVSDYPQRLEIRILDTGPGIPQSELEKVFDPYYRLEQSRSRETGGTGLGLTIARSVAESHGGQLTLRNRVEGGLEAVLRLPRNIASMDTAAARKPPDS
jgi:signal transduction histidine kinase